jgi:RNA polymerase sigma-70 factor, ECF subfamily
MAALEPGLRESLFETLPRLRAFAISLTGDFDRADDLVQDTVVKALGHLDSFERGTNLQAWLFTILRNLFYSAHRKRRREVEDPDGAFAEKLATFPEQGAHLDFEDMRKALARLSPEQREAIVLVGAEGVSYEEAAEICGVAIGTIKSRVNRARTQLAELLHFGDIEDIGPDRLVRAVLEMRG